MRIKRDDSPDKGTKQPPGSLEAMSVEDLQRELNALTQRPVVTRDRATLIRMITKLRVKKQADSKAQADGGTPKQQAPDLQAMDVAELQAKYKEVFGEDTISRNKEVLIEQIQRGQYSKGLKAKQEERKRAAEAKAETAAPTVTQRLVAIANFGLPELREEYERVFGKPSLSRNRKALLVRIAEKLQADAATPEPPSTLVAAPTLTVKFERKGTKTAAGKAKAHPKAKAAAEGKEAATRRKIRPAGQRDPRLPKVGTTIERIYKGKRLLVRVLEDGFEYQGKPYRSLSALAKHITGQIVNGFAWFQLGTKESKKS